MRIIPSKIFLPFILFILGAHISWAASPRTGDAFKRSPLVGDSFKSSSRYGGQIVLDTTSDPKSFNDILAKETSTSAVLATIFEGLTKTNAHTLKTEPFLAESWDISEDGLVWIFHLRHDVKWSDGVGFTADDVVFTYNDLIYNPDIPNSSADIFSIDGKPFVVEKVDAYTVKFTLPAKFAPFLRGVGQSILPKHKLEEAVKQKKFNFTWGIDTPVQEIVGTGPFKLGKYEPGQRVVLEKNPLYWQKDKEGKRLPYLDRLIFIIVQSEDVQLLKFLEGSTDSYDLRGMDYPLLKPMEKDRNFTLFDLGPDMGSQFIFFNQNTSINPETKKPRIEPYKLKWFTDLNFRKAVAYSIDKQKIIEIVKNGLGYLQDSSMGPGAGFFNNPNVAKYDYDLKKAQEVLTQAGYIDRDSDGIIEDQEGHKVEFSLYTNADSSERMDITGIIRHDLEKLGMKVNFQGLEFNTIVSKLTSTFEWDSVVLGLTGGVEPHFGQNVWHSTGGLHMWYPKEEKPATDWEKKIDELFGLGVQELNEDKRKVIYDEFQLIVSQQVPLIYTVLGAKLTAVRNKFGNLDPTNFGGVFHNLEEIYVFEEYK